MPVGLLSVTAAAVVLGACGGSAPSSAGAVRGTIDAYMHAVTTHDAGGACEQLSDAYQREVLRASGSGASELAACRRVLAKGLKAEPKPVRRMSLRVVSVRVRGARADAIGEEEVSGLPERTAIGLVHEHGHWRIAAMSEPKAPDGRPVLRVASAAMSPTLNTGTRVLLDASAYRSRAPAVGDLVAFHPPAGAEAEQCGDRPRDPRAPCAHATGGRAPATYLKRVVAGPGDRVAIRRGRVIRNGHQPSEPFIARCGAGAGCDFPKAITVPQGQYYLLGDNRGGSSDSRFWGAVPVAWILGTVSVASK